MNTKLVTLPDQMKVAMDKLTKACGDQMTAGEAKECTALSDKIGKMPDDFADAAKVNAFTADLATVEVKRAQTKEVVTNLTSVVNGLAKVTADAKTAESKAKAAADLEDAALKKQNTSVDTLNKFCSAS